MQKTRIGITVGALGAITFFAALFGGYMPAIILAGYALLFEENIWLRRSVIKAVVLMVFFSVVKTIINFIPDAVNLIGNAAAVFNGHFSLTKVTQITTVVSNGLNIVEKVLFLGLGFKALGQATIVIPFIDSRVSKYID